MKPYSTLGVGAEGRPRTILTICSFALAEDYILSFPSKPGESLGKDLEKPRKNLGKALEALEASETLDALEAFEKRWKSFGKAFEKH